MSCPTATKVQLCHFHFHQFIFQVMYICTYVIPTLHSFYLRHFWTLYVIRRIVHTLALKMLLITNIWCTWNDDCSERDQNALTICTEVSVVSCSNFRPNRVALYRKTITATEPTKTPEICIAVSCQNKCSGKLLSIQQ